MQDAISKEGGYNVGGDVRAPEEAQTDGQLLALVEVAEVQHDIRDEAALDQAEQRAGKVEGGAAGYARLAAGDGAPGNHLDGDPDVRAELLGDHL